MDSFDEVKHDEETYKVVVNHEEQYSLWPESKSNPLGWRDVGKAGTKDECLAYIKEVWTDMRPASLRKKMGELAESRPSLQPNQDGQDGKSLVDRLSDNVHPVEASTRPEKTLTAFRSAIERKYVHVKFTDTKGGTELGFRLDSEACDFGTGDFEGGTGTVHIEGKLTLDYVHVKCVADINLDTLVGTGHLIKLND